MTIPPPTRATGSHFYHYANADHLEWLKVIILNHELYLPTLTQLNDPADGRPKLATMSVDELISFLWEKFVRNNPGMSLDDLDREEKVLSYNVHHYGREKIRELMADALYSELDAYRIYSMSKRYDNMVLWGTYAGSHTGYCLEFANEGPLFAHAMEVTYGDYEVSITDPALNSGYFFFCKSPGWSYEEEIRLILPRQQGSKVKLEPSWLTRVILGYKMSESNRRLIREWAKQRDPEVVVIDGRFDTLQHTVMLETSSAISSSSR